MIDINRKTIAISVPIGVVLTVGMLQLVPPILVFGGEDCHTTGQLIACTGYPPGGLALIGVVSFIVATYLQQLLESRQNRQVIE